MRARRVNVPGLVVIAGLAAVWEMAVRSGAIEFDYLPAPSAIVGGGWALIASGDLFVEAAHTLYAVWLGWMLAVAIGSGLGLLLGLSSAARTYLQASLELLRPLPAIAFLPVALLIFNFSLTTELVVIVYAATWPVFMNTMGGVMAVASRLHDVARTLRLTRAQAVANIVLPAALPAIVVGCRLSLGLSLVMAIIAEMLGNPHGLGHAIMSELQAMQPERMFAYVIIVGILAIVLNAGLRRVGAYLLRGHPPEVAEHV